MSKNDYALESIRRWLKDHKNGDMLNAFNNLLNEHEELTKEKARLEQELEPLRAVVDDKHNHAPSYSFLLNFAMSRPPYWWSEQDFIQFLTEQDRFGLALPSNKQFIHYLKQGGWQPLPPHGENGVWVYAARRKEYWHGQRSPHYTTYIPSERMRRQDDNRFRFHVARACYRIAEAEKKGCLEVFIRVLITAVPDEPLEETTHDA